MSTLGTMKTLVARDLRDPSNKTFSATEVGDLILSGLTEVGRLAPERFQEDLTVVADTLRYQLRMDEFLNVAVPELEVVRVEVWDITDTPDKFLYRVRPADAEYQTHSYAGWKLWGGFLELPNWIEESLTVGDHSIRVWGYSPYPMPADDNAQLGVSNELEQAIRAYCRVEAAQRLLADRTLFTQWQTRANNSDVSPAALMNDLNIALEDWRRRSRAITVLREAPA